MQINTFSLYLRHEHAKIELKNSKRNYDKSEKDLSLPRNEVARQKNIMEEKQKMVSSVIITIISYLGPVSTRDNRVLKGPLGRSLRSFARTAHSLRSALLALLARSIHRLAHSLRSLPRGTVEIYESVFTL